MSRSKLETPASADALYMVRGSEADVPRPVFTGDVYEHEIGLLILVQHPCALRRGLVMHENLLAASVKTAGSKPRSDWNNHAIAEMPLPGLKPGHFVADFLDVHIVKSDSLADARRLAILSEQGVNLLMQRWVYHCSRVVIPTITFNDQTFGPFNEADLALEWIEDREGHLDPGAALEEFDDWVRDSAQAGQRSRQERLGDRQEANAVRREARAYLRAALPK